MSGDRDHHGAYSGFHACDGYVRYDSLKSTYIVCYNEKCFVMTCDILAQTHHINMTPSGSRQISQSRSWWLTWI